MRLPVLSFPGFLLLLLLLSFPLLEGTALGARCLYVSSYHDGYVWNDDIENAMAPILKDHCKLKKFYLDGKRQTAGEFTEQKALEAKVLIDSWQPDIVIAADDLASKYLVMPYLKDAPVPVVFCGINWTVEPYGYPYANTTGMIEIGPIDPLVDEVKKVVPSARHGIFLSADELTQTKEFSMNQKAYAKYNITISHSAHKSMAQWQEGYKEAQEHADFIILGNNAGINDWDDRTAAQSVLSKTRIFTVTYLDWMAPYAMLAMAKIAAEQGEWAANSAVLILKGRKPSTIPIVPNRRWNMFVNPTLLEKAGIVLSTDILQRAVKVGQ